jgi:uncharacterized protein YjbI with pentapeptide repeats
MTRHTDRSLRLLVARSSVGERHVPLDLAGQDLELVNLPFVDLRGANLAGANLRGAMLWGARLESACLDGADLTCADLTWSSLVGASLRGALLIEADLDEATVDASLREASTAGADLITITFAAGTLDVTLNVIKRGGKNLIYAVDKIKAILEGFRRKAAEKAAFERHRRTAPPGLRSRGAAGFRLRSEREAADDWYAYKQERFRRANSRVLTDADLRELLSWSRTTAKPLNLRGCNLAGADLRGARLDGACLAYADMTGADICGASFAGADRSGSYGW